MKLHQQHIEDRQIRMRQLVAEYTEHGAAALKTMHQRDRELLLKAKRQHLAAVEGRCQRAEGLHVNVPLRKLLQGHVKEIKRSVERGLHR